MLSLIRGLPFEGTKGGWEWTFTEGHAARLAALAAESAHAVAYGVKLTGVTVHGTSLRVSRASRIAASEVNSLTEPPGPAGGIST